MGSFYPLTQSIVTSYPSCVLQRCEIPTRGCVINIVQFSQQYITRKQTLQNRPFVVLKITVGKLILTVCKCISYDKSLNKGKILFNLHPTFNQIS